MNIIQVLILKIAGLHDDYVGLVGQNVEMKNQLLKQQNEQQSLHTALDYWKGLQKQTVKERNAELERATELSGERDVLLQKVEALEVQLASYKHNLGETKEKLKIAEESGRDLNIACEELNKKYHDVLDERVDIVYLLVQEKIKTRELAELLSKEQDKFAQSQQARVHQRDTIAELKAEVESLKEELAKTQNTVGKKYKRYENK